MTAPAMRVVGWNLTAFKRLWRANVVTSFLQPVLYLLGMGLGVGTLVDDNSRSLDILGTNYVAFIAPGLLAATAMIVAQTESSFPVADGFMWSRYYQAMVATPLRPVDVVAGHALWSVIRCMMACSAVAVAMALFSDARSSGLIPAVPCAALCGLAFSMPIAAYASTKKVDTGFAGLNRFVIIPLFLFGGAFYPLSQLPGWLRPVGYATPIWHGVELCRGFTLGTIELLPAIGHIAYLLLWVAVGAAFAVRTFTKRLYA